MSDAEKRLDRKGLILLIGAGIVLVVTVVIGMLPQVRLGDDLCPENESKLTDRIAVIIDPTDVLNTRQSRDAVSEVLRLIEIAPEHTGISLYDVRSSSEPIFHVCKPRHHNSIGLFKSFYINKDFVERDYKERFQSPLLNKLDSLLTGAGSNQSPIIKTLQNISVDAFGSISDERPRQVIIVSDMVQHSDDWSFFRDPLDFRALSSHQNYRTMKAHNLGSDQEGDQKKAKVTILLLARRGQSGLIQNTNGFKSFWKEYFIDQGVHKDSPKWTDITG